MQRKTLLAAVVAAAFAFPLAATAGGKDKNATSAASGDSASMFKTLDKNGDGFISKDEATGGTWSGDFASLDKNKDGKLSRDEFASVHGQAASTAKSGNSNMNSSSASSPTSSSSNTTSGKAGAASTSSSGPGNPASGKTY